ncbi:alpha/beta fold hydrolase [Flavitalea flava]
MPNVKNKDVEINYTITGKGEHTLLFVHGSFIDQTYWKESVAYFSPHYQVVTLDLGGHGKSGQNREIWTIQEFGEDLLAVLRQLNLSKLVLIGHSMGADVILEAAIQLPEPILGFIGIDYFKNAGSPLPEEFQKQVATILEKLKTDFSDTSEAYARMALLTPQTDKSITDRIVAAYRSANPDMGAKSIAALFSYYKRERELMKQLTFKMHLINVGYMPTNEAPLKEYARSSYELITLPGSCHYPMLENPQVLNMTLEGVIEKIVK